MSEWVPTSDWKDATGWAALADDRVFGELVARHWETIRAVVMLAAWRVARDAEMPPPGDLLEGMAVLIDDTTEEEPVKVVPRATVLERFDAQARYASSGLADTAGPGHLWVVARFVARFGTREHHALVWQPRNLRGETPPPGGACPCGAAHGGAFTAGGSA